MSVVAIITARGSSKRIPRKNLKYFCGRPIIEYSIEAALNSGIFDEVMVSTEDPYIIEVINKCGAKIPFIRTERNASDFATTSDVLLEVLNDYKNIGIEVDKFCCIYPTAPFVTAEKLHIAMKILAESDADSVIPIVRFSYPPQRSFIYDGMYIRSTHAEYLNCRSQELDPLYHDCGQFYCARAASFTLYKSLVMPKTLPLIMSQTEVQDIDDEDDWTIAEMKYELMQKTQCDLSKSK